MMRYILHLLPVILPVLFWAGYHYYKDRHLPEPVSHLLLAFILGIGSYYLGMLMYQALDLVNLRHDAYVLAETNLPGLFAYAILVIGVIEEFAKMIPFLLVVIHFKEFNDYFGHVQGDHCLRKIASALQYAIRRPLDKVGRYGGEEFILAWYDCDEQSALEIGEAAREMVEALAIPHGPGATQRAVTISIGVATGKPRAMMDSGSLIRAADRALYEAKSGGRNRVTLASDQDFTAKAL